MADFFRSLLALVIIAHPLVDCVWEHSHAAGSVQAAPCSGVTCGHHHARHHHRSTRGPSVTARLCQHRHADVHAALDDLQENANSPDPYDCPEQHPTCGLHSTLFLTAPVAFRPGLEPSAWTALAGDAPSRAECRAFEFYNVWCDTGPPPHPVRLHLFLSTLLI